eukprot:23085-Amphidinium_carterae.1
MSFFCLWSSFISRAIEAFPTVGTERPKARVWLKQCGTKAVAILKVYAFKRASKAGCDFRQVSELVEHGSVEETYDP